MMRGHVALVTAVVWAAGCSPPMQSGEIEIAPGASDRLRMAMRYGYQGDFDAVAPRADVRIATRSESIPGGDARDGRVGDWVLDGGTVLAVVANIDGTARSGQLIDVVRGWTARDDLVVLETRVLGQRVVYDQAKTGRDPKLGSAFVSVSGSVDQTAAGGPVILVETRYDVAPKLDVILISTRLTVTRAAEVIAEAPEVEAEEVVERSNAAPRPSSSMEDRLNVHDGESYADTRAPQVTALGLASGYTLQPLGDARILDRSLGFAYGRGELTKVGDWELHSRALVALERSDTLSAELAYLRTLGTPTGQIEIALVPSREASITPTTGDFQITDATGLSWMARGVRPCGAGFTYLFSAPNGTYRVAFTSKQHQSERPISVHIPPSGLARASLPVGVATAPYDPPPNPPRCPEPQVGLD